MSDLRAHLIRRIALEGPLTIAQYMEECLGNPKWGYYMTRDPLGRGGDFITAPEVSQMFGELLGIWAVAQWQALGRPENFHLVELGPGRGTLMADALRAGKMSSQFIQAAQIHLVEISPVLRKSQKDTLVQSHPEISVQWWNDVSQVPAGPLILLANEFFDALPIRQFVKTDGGWRERLIAVENGGLVFASSNNATDTPLVPEPLKQAAQLDDVVEICPAGLRKAHTIAARLKSIPGAALIIDYGHGSGAPGDTLQAVKDHAYAPILDDPGEADLTAHVDFQQLAETARDAGVDVYGPEGQGEFLGAMGIHERAEALRNNADDRQRKDLETALDRLTSTTDDGMGELFKVMALQHPGLPAPPGFA